MKVETDYSPEVGMYLMLRRIKLPICVMMAFWRAVKCHTAAKKLYAVLETGDGWPKIPGNTIGVYDVEFLTYQSAITLPGFLKGNEDEHPGFYESEGHFGFFNGNGSQFYSVVKTKSNYDPYDASDAYFPDDWAIVTVPVN